MSEIPEDAELWKVATRLPRETVLEMGALARELGMKRSHLLGMAAVIGYRHILRLVHPEQSVPREAWEAMAKAYGADEDALAKFLKAVSG
jgi:hypothetical protein